MISLVQKYLEINHFSNQKEGFEDLFQSHPNYPSVFAVTDTLNMLSIENIAIKVPKEQLLELPNSFLAIYNEGLVLVSKTSALINIVTEKGEKQDLSFNEFITGWDGIVIAIEPNETIENESLKSNSKWLIYSLPVLALIIVSTIYNSYGLNDFVLLLTSIIGLLFSVFIVQEKLGLKNQIVSKFCNISPNASCDSVIKSDKGEINKWVSFSDLPILFFSVNVLSIALQPASSSNVVGFLSLLSLPVILYSIWVQKRQLKKWCLLCLVISFIIVLQSVIWIFMGQPFLGIALPNLFSYLISLIVTTSFWLVIKPILENKIKMEKSINELKKFKRNYDVFNFLLKKIPVVKGLDQLEGLRFGNRNSEVNLTLILSPSCGHCHKAFQEAFELVSTFPQKISLNVLFNINPENNDNPYKVVVESLLAINNSNLGKMEEAISDWHIQKIGLEKWNNKWKIDNIPMRVNHQIEQQYNWCLENEFNYTPVKMVNDKLFPVEYDVNELKYFLNDFTEEKELLEMNSLVEV
ncbi:vitamin K epoxide reductase family protein [Flavobacterium sp. ZB4P13]|uniref:vitamin K epoxide reductase family protein n=1 Tax=Flavobacterium sp. ZB4P13 TaxID=3401728 RepID=UPI003AAEC660